MDTQELSDKLMGLIHQMATVALAVPPDDLEPWLVRNRQNCFDEAIANNLGVEQANAWADEMDKSVRALIGIIQKSGGGGGGTA